MAENDEATPTLYVFAVSHYCEKARWALDYLGIDYGLRHLSPGPHVEATRELRAPGSSLPLLIVGESPVQGSGAILDWAESRSAAAGGAKRLSPEPGLAAECSALERRLDDVAGVHARRYYYSEALVEHPESVLPIFLSDLEGAERRAAEDNWPIACQLMTGAMDLGPAQGRESREIVLRELDWLDGLLGDGRRYLLGDRFTRADLTAASLLAPIAAPPEHPTYARLAIPPRARADLEAWADRPIVAWIRELYRRHR